jgi:hypothetical protein
LLLWSAPTNANEVLRRPLSRQVFKSVYERKPLLEYVRQLEGDQSVEVEGYEWSGQLWRESFQCEAPLASAGWDCGRPVRSVRLDSGPASKLKGSAMGYAVSLNLDLSDLFADNFEWMAKSLAAPRGGSSESSH